MLFYQPHNYPFITVEPQISLTFRLHSRRRPMTTTATEQLRAAIDHAIAAGVSRRQIFAMVARAPPPPPRENWPNDPSEIVYDEVPAGMITLADAAQKYKVRHNTLNVAVSRERLPVAGSVTIPNRSGKSGGRKHRVVPEAAVRHYLGLPPDPDDSPDDELDRVPGLHELPIYTEAPEGLITATAAAQKLGMPVQRVHEWVRNGVLARMGYLRDGRQGRSALLVVEQEVTVLRMLAALARGGADDG